jgi:hypothetical protein
MPTGPDSYLPSVTDPLMDAYGVRDPAEEQRRQQAAQQAEQQRRAAMTHAPPGAPPAVNPQLEQVSPMQQAADRETYQQMQQVDQQFADAGFPGDGLPTPDALFGASDERARDADELRAMADQRVQWSAPNPVHPATQRFTGEMLGEDGLLEQQQQAHVQQQEARQHEARVLADTFDQRASQLRMQAVDQKAREFERQRQLDEQRDNQRVALDAQAEAVQQVREAQALDPDAWWKNKSTGGKIISVVALALGGLAGGWAGRPDFGAQLRSQMMEPELEKQKEEYARLQEGVGLAGQAADQERNLYAQVMSRVQDERQADLIVEAAMLEATQAEAEQMLAEAGIHTLDADQQVFMTELRQQLAQNRMQLEILSATTPKMVGGTSYALDPTTRAALTREASRMDRRDKGLEDIGMGMIQSEAIDRPKEDRQAERKRGQASHAAAEARVGQAAKELSEFEAGISTADEVLGDLATAGVGGRLPPNFTAKRKAMNRKAKSLGIENPEEYGWVSDMEAEVNAARGLLSGEETARRRFIESEQHERVFGRERQHAPIRTPEAAAGPGVVRED